MLKAVRFLCFMLLLAACQPRPSDSSKATTVDARPDSLTENPPVAIDTVNTVSPSDYRFFATQVLGGHEQVLRYYFNKYRAEDYCPSRINRISAIQEFEGIHYLGNINHNATPDSVFVLGPLNQYCRLKDSTIEDGKSYYFTDTTLPRLRTESYCCHPNFLFLVGDIDEDGISEIGQYSTVCTSRFKGLNVYTLKNNDWKEVGHVIYDLSYADSTKPYSEYVKKTGRNQFKMLEITDTKATYRGKPHWIHFSMK